MENIITPEPRFWNLFEIREMFRKMGMAEPKMTDVLEDHETVWVALVLKDSRVIGYDFDGYESTPFFIEGGEKFFCESMSKILVDHFGISPELVMKDAHYKWFVLRKDCTSD